MEEKRFFVHVEKGVACLKVLRFRTFIWRTKKKVVIRIYFSFSLLLHFSNSLLLNQVRKEKDLLKSGFWVPLKMERKRDRETGVRKIDETF